MSETLTLRDVTPGMCWRFTGATAPDCKPTYTMTDEEASDEGPRFNLPRGWDDHYWEDVGQPLLELSEFYQANYHQPIMVLMHYSKAPKGLPLEDYEAVPQDQVRARQWFIGPWDGCAAKSVAASLNQKERHPSVYSHGYGPTTGNRWVVVRTMNSKVSESMKPVASEGPVVRSCVDPLDKDLTDLRCRMANGVNGIECLWRYEYAQKHEQLARVPGGLVSTHGEYGMTTAQVSLAQDLWALELKKRQRDEVTKERMQVLCDLQDEP